MKQRPIIFSKPMVLAILAGHKTQTRRIAKNQANEHPADESTHGIVQTLDSPYGKTGDLLWVKETWRSPHEFDQLKPSLIPQATPIDYLADSSAGWASKWRTPLFMPRWASRITLEIVDVRMERLQEISEADAKAEGMQSESAVAAYKTLWEHIHGVNAWKMDPLVWLIEFRSLH